MRLDKQSEDCRMYHSIAVHFNVHSVAVCVGLFLQVCSAIRMWIFIYSNLYVDKYIISIYSIVAINMYASIFYKENYKLAVVTDKTTFGSCIWLMHIHYVLSSRVQIQSHLSGGLFC